MKDHLNNYVLFIFFLAFTGCASQTGVDPSRLQETKKKNSVILKTDFRWEEKFTLIQSTHYMTLKSGRYRAYLDNGNKGTYYEGEGACLEWKTGPTATGSISEINNYKCGVYLPNDKKNRVIVYYYIDAEEAEKITTQTRPGVLIEALSKSEWNNLKHLVHQPDALKLKSHIEIAN